MYVKQVVASMLAAIGAFYWLAGAGVSGPAALARWWLVVLAGGLVVLNGHQGL